MCCEYVTGLAGSQVGSALLHITEGITEHTYGAVESGRGAMRRLGPCKQGYN
jgi:hypothetical protein